MGQNAHTPQERVARKLCELMGDEWKLGRKLYMATAADILSDIGYAPEPEPLPDPIIRDESSMLD